MSLPRDNQPNRDNRPAGQSSRARRLVAYGLVTAAVLALVLWFGVLSTSAGRLDLAQAAPGIANDNTLAPLDTTPTRTFTPVRSSTPTRTPTATPTPDDSTPTTVPTSDCPPAGCPVNDPPTGVWQVDQVFYGQVPPGGGADLPVLVFIPGLTSIAQDWWTDGIAGNLNDMYLLAYNAGYRTAFMNLNQGGGRGPDSNEYVNGNTVFQQLQAITKHYKVSKVVAVTHSKGGIDLQDAIAAQTAAPMVSTAFMLSAPSLGSQLASIECTPTTTTLTAICAMSPPMMSVFRSTYDDNLSRSGVTFYQAGGTDHGQPGTVLYVGGTFLSQYGSSDGFVPVSSTLGMPGAKYLFVRSYNHDNILVGHNSFPFIDAILRQGTPQPAGSPTPTLTATPVH
jgi:hypothetical protein